MQAGLISADQSHCRGALVMLRASRLGMLTLLCFLRCLPVACILLLPAPCFAQVMFPPFDSAFTEKKKGGQRPRTMTDRPIAAPEKWLKVQKQQKLSDKHMHMALALSVCPKDFRKMADRARSKGLTFAQKLEAMYGVGGGRKPHPDEPFLTALWRLSNRTRKRQI